MPKKRIEKDDEETHIAKCHGYAMQEDWVNIDAAVGADLSWRAKIYYAPQEPLKFLINSTRNVLPTLDNLRRWGKAVVDVKCDLCGFTMLIFKHVLSGCCRAFNKVGIFGDMTFSIIKNSRTFSTK